MQAFYSETMTVIVIPALLALAGYAVRALVALLREKTGIEIDAAMSASLHAALERYIRGAIAKNSGAGDLGKVLATQEIAAGAADYVQKMNPGAVKRFDLDRQKIEDLARPYIDALS